MGMTLLEAERLFWSKGRVEVKTKGIERVFRRLFRRPKYRRSYGLYEVLEAFTNEGSVFDKLHVNPPKSGESLSDLVYNPRGRNDKEVKGGTSTDR